MRDANARQLRLNQIDLNVNAEMQLGRGGFWLNIVLRNSTPSSCGRVIMALISLWQLRNDVAAVSYL